MDVFKGCASEYASINLIKELQLEGNMELAVIFDMDGVIVDNNRYHRQAWKQLCESHGSIFTDEKYYTLVGRTIEENMKIMFEDLTSDQIREYSAEKETCYRKAFEKHIRPLTGLIPFLQLLEKNNIKRALATSAPSENVDFVLGKTKTRRFFRAIIDDSKASRGKPDPEIFLKAAELINMDPADCIVFEDGVNGIEAAKRAGMKAVALTTTFPAEKLSKADVIIKDFAGVDLGFLKKLINSLDF